jgi:hypothetical protein
VPARGVFRQASLCGGDAAGTREQMPRQRLANNLDASGAAVQSGDPGQLSVR